jgi:hypothetical protein
MHKSLRCFLRAILVLLVLGFGATRASAQAGKIIIEGGKWLGKQILDYATGKTFDRLLGIDYETQLKQVETNLVAQLRKGAGDAQNLRVELDATRSQLSMLQTLLYSKPTSNQLEQFRQQLTSDLARVVKVQQEHTQKIASLEGTTQDHEARLKRLEERENAEKRNEVEQPPQAAPRSWQEPESLRQGQDSSYREQTQQPRKVRNSGVTLIVRVTGQANEIDVSETEDFTGADIGSFEIESARKRYFLQLLADTGGVIDIRGDGNTIYLPRNLCGRIRVIRKGRNNWVDGCK